jgi:hypothetical protein
MSTQNLRQVAVTRWQSQDGMQSAISEGTQDRFGGKHEQQPPAGLRTGSVRMSNFVETGCWSAPRVSTTGHMQSLHAALKEASQRGQVDMTLAQDQQHTLATCRTLTKLQNNIIKPSQTSQKLQG